MHEVVMAEVFWYAVGRFFEWADGSIQDFGYFVRLGEIPPPLFRGAPGPGTAHFTFAADPFRSVALPVDDPSDPFSATIDSPGFFRIFYNPEPCADFEHVESFTRGTPIATFERIGLVVGASSAQGASNLFSARLTEATAFEYGGHRYDLRAMLGRGITQMGSAGPAFTPRLKEAKSARSFVGTAIRI
jgi:hypothetical protein